MHLIVVFRARQHIDHAWVCARVQRLTQIAAHVLVSNAQQLTVRADIVAHVVGAMAVLVFLVSLMLLLQVAASASNIRG